MIEPFEDPITGRLSGLVRVDGRLDQRELVLHTDTVHALGHTRCVPGQLKPVLRDGEELIESLGGEYEIVTVRR
jgi:hypothetical protein